MFDKTLVFFYNKGVEVIFIKDVKDGLKQLFLI